MAAVMLEEVELDGQAGQFAGGKHTFFLALRGEAAADDEHFQEGDIFAVTEGVDVEVGDLVVWWTGVVRTLALARVEEDLSFRGVGGFPAPTPNLSAKVRGVVVGRLRPLAPGAMAES